MSPSDYKSQRMGRNEARKQVTKIMGQQPENVRFSSHALKELDNDDLTTVDALNVLKSPDSRIEKDGELERGTYRYRLETNNLIVVVALYGKGDGLTVVTAWDKRKQKKEDGL